MKKIFILLITFLLTITLFGCDREDDPESKGLTQAELLTLLKLDDDQYWSYHEDKITFTLQTISFNGENEDINLFRFLGNDQYEFVCQKHTYVISFSTNIRDSIYVKIDNTIRQKYLLKTISDDPIDDPTDDPIEEPEKPVGLNRDELFAILSNNNETWSSKMSNDSDCVRFIEEDYTYCFGKWPEGTNSGKGTLTKLTYLQDNQYQLDIHFKEVAESEFSKYHPSYDETIYLKLDPENTTTIAIGKSVQNQTIYYPDANTVVTEEEFCKLAKGVWASQEMVEQYMFEYNKGTMLAYISKDGINFENGEVFDYLAFGHYEYQIFFHVEKLTGEDPIVDEGYDVYLNLTYYPSIKTMYIMDKGEIREYKVK